MDAPNGPPRLRHGRDSTLKNPNRRRVHACIREDPGIGVRGIATSTGLAPATVRYHLGVLKRAGLLRDRTLGGTLRYFSPEDEDHRGLEAMVLLRDDGLNRLHAWLAEHPGRIQKEILGHAMDAWGWSRTTAQHRLRRLVSEGLVHIDEDGGTRRHTALGRPGNR